MMDLRSLARALGGEVSGRAVLCPGPGHSPRDRSVSVMPSPSAPDGLMIWSHGSSTWQAAKDHVRALLGTNFVPSSPGPDIRRIASKHQASTRAVELFEQSQDPRGTLVERYLARRGLALPEAGGGVLRLHPVCPFAGTTALAMVALVRDIVSDAPKAIHRTALDNAGRKAVIEGKDRLALGPIAGGAVKLTADEAVTTCLGIGEGIESTLSLRLLPEFGASPVWSLLSAGGVAAFPVLPGIECLWIAVDHDPAGERASRACADRWRAAGREAFLVKPSAPRADLNDLVAGAYHA